MTKKTTSTDYCTSYSSGDNAQFRTDYARLRVVGADGRFIYATDTCGIRRIDPGSGAVTSLTSSGNFGSPIASVAIAGKYLYFVDNVYGGLTQIDLDSSRTILLNKSTTGAVAADDTAVWIVSGTYLLKIDPVSGNAVTISDHLATGGHTPTAILSVGDYLYA
ncbi:hypothetical protein, partial [Paractinoplanes toevensis]|uniref:hypothetical protein n=1 Tax=Paractinoplanes toevensis TaxID=571911 RepID=UPI001BB34785